MISLGRHSFDFWWKATQGGIQHLIEKTQDRAQTPYTLTRNHPLSDHTELSIRLLLSKVVEAIAWCALPMPSRVSAFLFFNTMLSHLDQSLKQTTYTKTTTYRPHGGRHILEEEETIIRTPRYRPRPPSPPFHTPRSTSRSPSPRPFLSNTRFPHSFYEDFPTRRRSFERHRSTIRRQRSRSTVRFSREETTSRSSRVRTLSPSLTRGQLRLENGLPSRRGRSPSPPRLRLRSHSRSRSRSTRRRRSHSRLRCGGKNDRDRYIRGALAAGNRCIT